MTTPRNDERGKKKDLYIRDLHNKNEVTNSNNPWNNVFPEFLAIILLLPL